jgi:hypothetical protein
MECLHTVSIDLANKFEVHQFESIHKQSIEIVVASPHNAHMDFVSP